MATWKLAAFSPTKPRRWPAIIRCPVEDTGTNSVSPSTTPKMKATSQLSMYSPFSLPGQTGKSDCVDRAEINGIDLDGRYTPAVTDSSIRHTHQWLSACAAKLQFLSPC